MSAREWQVRPPSASVAQQARVRWDELAKPLGALGRLEDVAVWWSACQGRCPADPPQSVRAVVLAGDHGISRTGVSAYPPEVTAAMVRTMLAGRAAVNLLAEQHGVAVRVLDLGVDADAGSEEVAAYKVRRSSGVIDREDALSLADYDTAFEAGTAIAREEIEAGADLLIIGDMGIGNTTPAAALVAASLGVGAEEITGRGTGLDDEALHHKAQTIQRALDRVGARAADPVDRLQALASADLVAGVAFLITAARAGVPVLLDGIVPVTELVIADELVPGTASWCQAGHRSTEPAQRLALDKLGLEPLLDLGLRLGEGTGALAAVPLVRSAALLLRDLAQLSDVVGG